MKKKICAKCKQEKAITEFFTRGKENRRTYWCKVCLYEYQKNRWIDRKRKAVELLGGKCQLCGYNKNLAVFDFHHLDPSKKEYEWGKLKQLKWKIIIKELKKCILTCANCHREIHSLEQNLITETEGVHNNLLDIKHKFLISTGKCPNCQKPTYGTKYCCVKCVKFHKRKVSRPRKKSLKKMLKENNFCAIGRKYGVSDNAVRKWAKNYNLL